MITESSLTIMIIVMVVSKCATLEVSHFKNALVEYICIGRVGSCTVDYSCPDSHGWRRSARSYSWTSILGKRHRIFHKSNPRP